MRRPVYRSAPWQSSSSGTPTSPYYAAAGQTNPWHRLLMAYSWTLLSVAGIASVLLAAL